MVSDRFVGMALCTLLASLKVATANVALCSEADSGYQIQYLGESNPSANEWCYTYFFTRSPSNWQCDADNNQAWNTLYFNPCGSSSNGNLDFLHLLNKALANFDSTSGAAFDTAFGNDGYLYINQQIDPTVYQYVFDLCLNEQYPVVQNGGDLCFYTYFVEAIEIEYTYFGDRQRRYIEDIGDDSDDIKIYYVCFNNTVTAPDICNGPVTTAAPTDRPTGQPSDEPTNRPTVAPSVSDPVTTGIPRSTTTTSAPSSSPTTSSTTTSSPTAAPTVVEGESNPNLLITGGSVCDTIELDSGLVGDLFIDDVQVYLDIDHTWTQDLTISLTHDESGTSVLLYSGRCGCNQDNIQAYLTDDSNTDFCDACATSNVTNGKVSVAGTFYPFQALSTLKDLDVDSNYTLCVNDSAPAFDNGLLVEWNLTVAGNGAPAPSTNENFTHFESSPGLIIKNATKLSDSIDVNILPLDEMTDIKVYVEINHTWVSDLVVELTHEDSGTTVVLYNAGCDLQCSYDNLIATFDDEDWVADGCRSCEQPNCAVCGGPYHPVGDLNDFFALNPNSQWTLSAYDVYEFNADGVLLKWGFDIVAHID